MLSLANVGIGTVAAAYYEATDDYYTGNHSPSNWWGQATTNLGLTGQVDPVLFANLLEGKLPTGETVHHAAAGRRGGTDATFSAPKSVSLQALIGGDTRLLKAHDRAVDKALGYAETFAACRVTENGQTRAEKTGNLLVARFDHDLSRACDPQLHTHCVMLNATRRSDGQWRALNNEALYRHKMLLGALYRAELAREVQALGYQVRTTHLDGRFELDHIDDLQVQAFSQRSAAIETYLRDQGQERSEARAWVKKLAAVITRDKKTAVDRETLRHEWKELSREQGIDYTPPDEQSQPIARREAVLAVVAEAVAHLGEREAVFSHSDLLRAALERGVGVVTLDDVEAMLKDYMETGSLIQRDDLYTTPAAQQREAEILALETQGRDSIAAIYEGERKTLLDQLGGLTEDQRNAALGVLLTRNQMIGIQGHAGVGKTTLLSVTTALAFSCGYTVKGLAPSASAARELASTGISTETITSFAMRENKGLTPKTLLIVDEAGMASSKQMHLILHAATEADCRVVIVGDTAQLAAVEAGKPFSQLQKNGMATAVVGQIQRQKNTTLKHAVELASSGQASLAIELLDKEITQIVSAEERFERIAADYATLSSVEQSQTMVVAGTRHARAEINARIRDRLRLGDEGEAFVLLTRKDLTDSQRRSTLAYEVGDVVQAEINYPSLGLKRGELAGVVARLNHQILLERKDGARVAWQPALTNRLSAFVPETRRLAKGDLVRVTANDRGRRLVNGDLAKVMALDNERQVLMLALTDGRMVSLDGTKPLTLDYGYCSTVYAAQGQTCEQVLIEADAHSLTASQNMFYVAISRARQRARIYTDDREMLPLAMSREYEKSSALELSSDRQKSYDLDTLA